VVKSTTWRACEQDHCLGVLAERRIAPMLKIGLKIALALLAALAAPVLAQAQGGNRDQPPTQEQPVTPAQPGNQGQPANVERIDSPQGTVTVVRPPPLAQPATPRPRVNPDPVPPPPGTPFLTDQLGAPARER
jgi:hypothetical protein